MKITDNIIFYNRLKSYANNEFAVANEPMLKSLPVNICDDYKSEQAIFNFDNVKFRVGPGGGANWIWHPIGVVDGKAINISNKMLSYFPIIVNDWTWQRNEVIETYTIVKNGNEFTTIDEDVFQFFDCFPFAPVHNLDDTYNLLYQYIKNNLKCKLLVLRTNNFYYNQTLDSLKKYFNLEYIYIEPNKNYILKKLYCTRQYHWIQDDALAFIKKEYIEKICQAHIGRETHDNIAIVKTGHASDASSVDMFQVTQKYTEFLNKHNILDINKLRDDLEYKIYVVNNAKNIIASYLSPFNVNIHKHCLKTDNKRFMVLNGAYGGSVHNQFIQASPGKYTFYGLEINGVVIDNKVSLDEVERLCPLFN